MVEGAISEKNPVGSTKENEAGTFLFAKKSSRKNISYLSYSLSKCFSNLLPGLQVKPKIQFVTFSSDTNYGKGSIGGICTANGSLVPPV